MNTGKKVKVHYTGTLDDGTKFDSSYDRGQTLDFTCMAGQMIPGFDKAVKDMEPGQTVNIRLAPEEAYGERDPRNVIKAPIDHMPGAERLSVGDRVVLTGPQGQQIPVTVTFKDDQAIEFDANHEMAGKHLNFEITLVEVEG
ncbi:MAG: peptidylprolyl isomerase [Coriobacteriales bacterium]|nr:peptidylprolyl isomerase [Coriobacteriaceae bacterium]